MRMESQIYHKVLAKAHRNITSGLIFGAYMVMTEIITRLTAEGLKVASRLICGSAGGVGYITGDASYITHLSAYFGLVCYAWSQRHKNHLYVFGSDLRAA